MLKKIDIKFVLGAIASFTVAFLILQGKSGIHFVDPLNEMFTCAFASMLGLVCVAAIKK
jgi:hypothetical protein